MKLRLNKWRHYLVALTALVAVATGIAATPLRKTFTPFVTRPLGSWSLPVARSTGQATPAAEFHASSAVASRTDELEGLAALGDRKLAPAGGALSDSGVVRDEVLEHGSGSASTNDNGRQGDNWKIGSQKSGRSFSFGRSGGAGYSGGGRSAFSGSGSIGRAGSSNSANASGGGGSARGGINDPGPIFNEHKSGLPELTGGKLGAAAGGGAVIGGRATLASNPEPSTLILFGTGLATVVGSIRRRLRRQ
jgi:PEP-CTERM motif-containing protein